MPSAQPARCLESHPALRSAAVRLQAVVDCIRLRDALDRKRRALRAAKPRAAAVRRSGAGDASVN